MCPLKIGSIKRAYYCREEDLYEVLIFGLDNYVQYQMDFETFLTLYTAQWGIDRKAELQAAIDLPSFQQRDEMHEELRVQLEPINDNCCIEWKKLEAYIISSYPEAEHKTHLEAAGSLRYRKASRQDWGATRLMMEESTAFVTNNMAALTTGGMPVGFNIMLNTMKLQFKTLHEAFKQMETDSGVLRDEKIRANNEIFKTVSAMFKDGQKIFRNDPNIRAKFTFSKILSHVRGHGIDPTPDIPEVSGELDQVISQPDVNLGVKVNGKLFVNLNEGPVEEVTGDGTETIFLNKQYSTQQIFKLLITGTITGIIELHINEANLTDIKLHKDMKNLKELILQNNLLKTATIDDILITINKFNTSGGVISLIGNETPSAAGLAAKAQLEARGWTVLVS